MSLLVSEPHVSVIVINFQKLQNYSSNPTSVSNRRSSLCGYWIPMVTVATCY